jgi:hypothetical protein
MRGFFMNKWVAFVLLITQAINGMYSTDAAPVKYLLHEASRRGEVDVVERLLGHNANPNTLNAQGFTPLMVAHACAVEPLLKAKADPAIVDPKRWLTPLMIACYNVDERKVDLLLKSENAIPRAATNDGMTALHFVALTARENDRRYTPNRSRRWFGKGYRMSPELLEEKKKFIEEIKRKGAKLAAIAQNLLDYEANKKAKDRGGMIPLNYIKPETFRRPWNEELVRLLKDSGSV